MVGKLIVIGVVGCAALVVTQMRVAAARAAEAAGGCVVCGSAALDALGDRVRCQACGYEGAADGGGALTAQELQATAMQTPYDDR